MTDKLNLFTLKFGCAVLKARLLRQPRILTAQIMLNYTCNARCRYCSAPFTYDVMAFEKAQEILRLFKRHGTLQVSFAGGEPTLHPQYHPIMALSRELGYFITVSTNGLDPEPILNSTKDILPQLVSVSLDGPEDLHDAYRGRGSWKKVMATLIKLKESNIPRTIHAVIGKHNCHIDVLNWLLKTAGQMDAQLGFQFMLPSSEAEDKENPLASPPRESEALLKALIAMPAKDKKRLIFDNSVLRHLLTWKGYFPYYRSVAHRTCYAGQYFAFIQPDGLLAPCSLLKDHPWYKENYVSTAGFKQSLETIQRIPCNDCYLGCNILRNNLLSFKINAANKVWEMVSG